MHTQLRTGSQLRAARALAGITQSDLAERAQLHKNSIAYMERKAVITNTPCVVERVIWALQSFGVELITEPAPGVRLKG